MATNNAINIAKPTANGQLLIGAATGSEVWSTLTAGSNITITNAANSITIAASGGGSGITTLNGDSGSATGSTVTISGGSNLTSSATGSTLTINLDNSITVSGNISSSGGTLNAGGSDLLFNGSSFLSNNLVSGDIFMGYNISPTTGNIFIGRLAGSASAGGIQNIAIGNSAMPSSSAFGTQNIAIGQQSLQNLAGGDSNICIGATTGSNYNAGTESNNIIIGNGVSGTSGESNTTRIGLFSNQTAAYIAGIAGKTVSSSATVLINTSTGQLGTVASSRRYKENIEDMANASFNIYNLRPVTFNYKSDESKAKQYGLIAEEVLDIFPELISYDDKGNVDTVQYHQIPILLLNEIQKLNKQIKELQEKVNNIEQK